MQNFSINNLTKTKLPSLDFASMKDTVLGKDYSLSVTIVGESKISELNRQYRNIDKPTDILSFPLEKDCGEIFLNIKHTKLEAKKFERSYENFLAFLFIHGLVHLKGHDHGSTMEALEKRYRTMFGV